jgi:hypothetical protein
MVYELGCSRWLGKKGIMIPTTCRNNEKIQAANYNKVSKSKLLQSVLLFPYINTNFPDLSTLAFSQKTPIFRHRKLCRPSYIENSMYVIKGL